MLKIRVNGLNGLLTGPIRIHLESYVIINDVSGDISILSIEL